MIAVKADFLADFARFREQQLHAVGYVLTAGLAPHDILLRFHNFRRRSVPVVPRQVEEANDFKVPSGVSAGYAILKQKFVSGADVNKHLSTKLIDIDYEDHLLNDWGIHHFHLGTTVRADGFVDRTGPLLYARVLSDRILCIQICDHGSFADRDIALAMNDNWPEVLTPFRVKGLQAAPGTELTGKSLQKMRSGGVFTPLVLGDGTLIYPPGGGITSAATSAASVTAADADAYSIRQFEDEARKRMTAIMENTLAHNPGGKFTQPLGMHLEIRGDRLVAVADFDNSTVIAEAQVKDL